MLVNVPTLLDNEVLVNINLLLLLHNNNKLLLFIILHSALG